MLVLSPSLVSEIIIPRDNQLPIGGLDIVGTPSIASSNHAHGLAQHERTRLAEGRSDTESCVVVEVCPAVSKRLSNDSKLIRLIDVDHASVRRNSEELLVERDCRRIVEAT